MPRCGPAVVRRRDGVSAGLSHCYVADVRNSPRGDPGGGTGGVRPGGRGDRRRSGGNADHAARRSRRRLTREPTASMGGDRWSAGEDPEPERRQRSAKRMAGRTPQPRTLPERRFSWGDRRGAAAPLASPRLYRGYAGSSALAASDEPVRRSLERSVTARTERVAMPDRQSRRDPFIGPPARPRRPSTCPRCTPIPRRCA